MAQDGPKDPSAAFQQWVTEWERAFDKFSNDLMGTEEFSRSINQMQNLQLEMQRAFGEQMARQLAAFNMPSRDDVMEMAETIRDIDRRLARIEVQLRNLEPAGKNEPGGRRITPPRTRKPPSQTAQGGQS